MLSVPLVLILRWEGVAPCGAAGVRTFLPENALSSGLAEETGPIKPQVPGRRARLSSLNLTQKQGAGKQKAKNLLKKRRPGPFLREFSRKNLKNLTKSNNSQKSRQALRAVSDCLTQTNRTAGVLHTVACKHADLV